MHSRFRHRPDQRGVDLGCPGSAGGASGRATAHHQTSCRPRTPSFTSCGLTASGDCCHANFHRVARSTITFKPGETPVRGSIYIACSMSRPAVMPDGQLVHRW